jgi:hypothetical protein
MPIAGRDAERDVVDRSENAVRRLEALDDVVDDQNGIRGRGLRGRRVDPFKGHRSHCSLSGPPSCAARFIRLLGPGLGYSTSRAPQARSAPVK